MLTAAKEGTFSAPSDPCVLFPLAASGVYPKTRVWGSREKTLHCFSATPELRVELRRGCENSSGKTAAGSALDNNGNTLTKVDSTGTTTYTWDFENRLKSVTLPGTGGTVTFRYDPFGRRAQKSFTQNSTTTTTNFVYDGDNSIEEVDQNGTVLARYEQGLNIDEPLAMLRGTTTSYYNADGLGSVTSLSNSAGALAQTYTFDSFGNQTASTGSLTNSFRFTARESDTETGLYYYRARYYAPDMGRFLSEDPTRFDAGINFFRYTGNNPVNFNDPTGLLQLCCRPAKSVGGLACHCFLKLSDGHTLGGYFKPPPLLHKKIDDPDDLHPKDTPTCHDIQGAECKVRNAFQNLPTYQPYGFSGTSNSIPYRVLRDAGISYRLPACAWGAVPLGSSVNLFGVDNPI